ncbi:ATP-binding protein [Streptomyces xanthochromogenes]|uniref:ATP-binding protein n=1 Tax=Streptomyces xanthochromogenes TaxID=67384 RepID=UPI003445E7EB
MGADLYPPAHPCGPPTLHVILENGEAVGEARRLVRAFIADVRSTVESPVSDSTTELIELVVSELATNAYKYAPGPSRLNMEVHNGLVEVSVWDSNPNPPAIMPPDPLRIGQHGLSIVLAVAHTFTIRREYAGKRITAAIALTHS